MTGREWTSIVIQELTAAGFDVQMAAGWPLVKRSTDWDRGIALLELSLSVNVVRTIYAEGMLFLPPEVSAELASRRAAREPTP